MYNYYYIICNSHPSQTCTKCLTLCIFLFLLHSWCHGVSSCILSKKMWNGQMSASLNNQRHNEVLLFLVISQVKRPAVATPLRRPSTVYVIYFPVISPRKTSIQAGIWRLSVSLSACFALYTCPACNGCINQCLLFRLLPLKFYVQYLLMVFTVKYGMLC